LANEALAGKAALALRLRNTSFPLALLGMVAVVGIVLVTSFNHMSSTSPSFSRMVNGRVPVEAERITVVELREVVGAAGVIQPSSTVAYIAPFLGRVTHVPVDLGTVVRKGDLLVQFDEREFRAAADSALERIEAGAVIVEMTQRQVGRLRGLHDDDLISDRELQNSLRELAETRIQQAHAREDLVRARVNLERTRILAPMSGIVLERLVNPDEIVEKNQRMLALGSLDQVTLVAQVGEDKIGTIALGQTAAVTCDALPGVEFAGRIAKIDPSADPQSRVFSAYIRMDNPGLRLRPGMTGFARIQRSRRVLAVPSMALVNPLGDRATAFVIDQALRATQREVKIGGGGERMREVLDGLEEGQLVVTAGHHRLQDGDFVTLHPESPIQE